MPKPEGKPVSLWTCNNCGATGRGKIFIVQSSSKCTVKFDCWEPDGWWLTSKEILCSVCKGGDHCA